MSESVRFAPCITEPLRHYSYVLFRHLRHLLQQFTLSWNIAVFAARNIKEFLITSTSKMYESTPCITERKLAYVDKATMALFLRVISSSTPAIYFIMGHSFIEIN